MWRPTVPTAIETPHRTAELWRYTESVVEGRHQTVLYVVRKGLVPDCRPDTLSQNQITVGISSPGSAFLGVFRPNL